jgi:hypothetical protein
MKNQMKKNNRPASVFGIAGMLAAMTTCVCLSSCADQTTDPGAGPDDDAAEAEYETVFDKLQEAGPNDSDGDGVVNSVDECFTPVVVDHTSGNTRPKVSPLDGCSLGAMPKVCRGDYEPPRLVLGSGHPRGYYHSTADVTRREFDGRTVFSLRAGGGDDMDVMDTCPELNSKLVAAFDIDGEVYPWICEGREVPEEFNNPHPSGYLNRQVRIDDLNPCVFDPAAFGVADQDVQDALANGEFSVAVGMVVKDGKGNTLQTHIGEATEFSASICKARIRRDEYQTPGSTTYTACSTPTGCTGGLSETLSSPLLTKPQIPAGPSVLSHPTFVVQVKGLFQFDSDCGSLDVQGFLKNVTLAGKNKVVGSGKKLCQVTRPNGVNDPKFILACEIRPPSLYLPGAGEESLEGSIQIRARAGDEYAIEDVPFSFVL